MPHDLRYQPEPVSERDQRWLNARWEFKNDSQRYIAELEDLAENGCPGSQIVVGRLYSSDSGLPNDYEKAERWFRRAAKGDPAKANWYLGMLFMRQKKYEAASEPFKISAEQEYAPAYFMLGRQYYFGQGVAKDLIAARAYLQHAYDLGSQPAGYQLARLYLKGKGIGAKLKSLLLVIRVGVAVSKAQEGGHLDDELFYGLPENVLQDFK